MRGLILKDDHCNAAWCTSCTWESVGVNGVMQQNTVGKLALNVNHVLPTIATYAMDTKVCVCTLSIFECNILNCISVRQSVKYWVGQTFRWNIGWVKRSGWNILGGPNIQVGYGWNTLAGWAKWLWVEYIGWAKRSGWLWVEYWVGYYYSILCRILPVMTVSLNCMVV
jgi:hypothetical protein